MATTTDGATTTGRAGTFEYRPALDGLRAVAVLLVLVYHNDLYPIRSQRLLRGGFLGVDVFFVLSGYLITSLLVSEHAARGRIAVTAFWGRRVRRLLPALCVMLLIVAVYAWVIAAPGDLSRIRGDALATLFYVQNWHMILGDRSGSILVHAWSLSVEEQWYLVWPPVLVGLLAWQRSRRIRLSTVVGGLAAAATVWTYTVAALGSTGHAYLGTDTRAQELLIGAVLAVLSFERGPEWIDGRRAQLVAVLGAAVIVVFLAMAPTPGSSLLTKGGYTAFSIAVAGVIVAAVQPAGVVRNVLSVAPLRAVGIISYGVYLYHWPLYWFLTPDRVHVSGAALLLIRVPVTLTIATISFFVIERPIRRGTRIGARPFLFAPVAIVATLAVILVATRAPAVPQLIPPETMAAYTRIGAAARGTKVLVVGEARAFQLGYLGATNTRPGVTGLAVGFLDCGLVAGDIQLPKGRLAEPRHCERRTKTLQDLAAAFRPDVVVLMPDGEELFNRRVGNTTYVVGTQAWAAYVGKQLESARHALTAANHAPTLVVTVPCGVDSSEPPALTSVLNNQNRRRVLNQLLHSYAAAHMADVGVVDPAPRACSASPGAHPAASTALTRTSADALWKVLAPRALTAASGRTR